VQAYAEPETSPDEAFEQLYRLYVNDVYRYALALLHNPSDAEDVTQTTFLNAYRAFKRGEDPRKPQHWLIKIAHNACRSRYVRMARRPREVPLDESIARLPMPADDAIDVRELLAALGELPFNQRAALVMRELEDRSYRDIADTLGVTVPAVETLIFRARRRMRAERAALQALGAVQLPQSLASFFEGGGAIAGGGAAVGSGGLALKAVLMLAAGAVAGSVGYKTVTATAFPLRPSHQTAVAESARPPAGALPPAGTAFYASSTRVRVTSRVGSRAAGRFASVGRSPRGRFAWRRVRRHLEARQPAARRSARNVCCGARRPGLGLALGWRDERGLAHGSGRGVGALAASRPREHGDDRRFGSAFRSFASGSELAGRSSAPRRPHRPGPARPRCCARPASSAAAACSVAPFRGCPERKIRLHLVSPMT